MDGITDDHLKLTIGNRSVFVDLGAEKLFAAEKEGRKIAVEIKSFIGASPIRDLEEALGQYLLYSFTILMLGNILVMLLLE